MTRSITAAAPVALLCTIMLATSAAPVQAQGLLDRLVELAVGGDEGEIAVTADRPNVETEGPEAVTVLPGAAADGSEDQLLVVDPVRRRIVRVDRNGAPQGEIDLSETIRPVDAAVAEDGIYVLDALARRIFGYREDGALDEVLSLPSEVAIGRDARLSIDDEGGFRVGIGGIELRLGLSSSRGAPGLELIDEVERSVGRTGTLSVAPEAGARGLVNLDVTTDGFLADAALLGRSQNGAVFVTVDELGEDGLSVITRVLRYSADGTLEAEAVAPLDDAIHMPNRPLAVTPDGTVYALIPEADRVRLEPLTFEEPGGARGRGRGGALGQPGARGEAAIEDLPAAFDRAVNETADPVERARGKTSRSEIIARAEAYLAATWTLGAQNYGGGATPSHCAPEDGSAWRRPTRLTDRIGQLITGLPYDWGGYVSLAGFQRRIDEGQLAGDICTCRSSALNWCLVPTSTGVDCSGFVSQALGESYHTTSRMHEITTPLSDWRDLKPGDIINRKGRHVRLVTGLSGADGAGPLIVHTIESAVSCGGMCAESYELSSLRKYKPLRYIHVAD